TDDGLALGIANTNDWSDLFLATGGVINFENGDVTITHSANALAFAGGTSTFTLGAAEKVYLDATSTGHTGTAGALDIDAGLGADSVNAINIAATSSGDFTAVGGINITLGSGGMLTNSDYTYGVKVTPTSHASDVASTWLVAFEAANATSNGSETIALNRIGTGYDYAMYGYRNTNGNGDDLAFKAMEGWDDGVTARNGGNIVLEAGNGVNGGTNGIIKVVDIVAPSTNDGAALGVASTNEWSDLFLAAGGVINWANGDVTVAVNPANNLAVNGATSHQFIQAASSDGNPTAFQFTTGAHTNVTAATEQIGVSFALGAGTTWAAGAGPLAQQREIVFSNPTYNGNAGTPLTITDAATVFIQGAPIQGTNMTLTNSYALWSSGGKIRSGGDVVIDNGAGLLIGNPTQVTGVSTSELQVLGTSGSDSSAIFGRWSNNANPPLVQFIKSRNTTIGSSTVVQDNDGLGSIIWQPDDGTNFTTNVAGFGVEVDDATPTTGDVGVAFVWSQMPGGGGAKAETMRLSAAGALTPGVTDAGALGTTSLMWSDLFLASGSVINFNAGDVTLTHSAGALTFGGDGTVGIDFNNHEMTNVDIDSGAIDGTTVGAASPSTGAFTTITASSTVDLESYVAIGNGSALSADSGLIIDYDKTYTGVGQQLAVKGTVTGAAATNVYGALIDPESITIPTGTTTLAASLYIDEPNITETGTLTNAASLYIVGAASEAANNYALWVDAGATQLDGAVNAGGLFTGSLGATITGAVVNLNASSNFATNIGTGTTTAAVTIGGGSNTVEINSSDWDITTEGVMTGIGAITSDGVITHNYASAGTILDINATATSYTNGLGLIDVGRSGAITLAADNGLFDVRIAPTSTITEPASGVSLYNAQNIDLSGLNVTAGAGGLMTAGLNIVPSGDTDSLANFSIYLADDTDTDSITVSNDLLIAFDLTQAANVNAGILLEYGVEAYQDSIGLIDIERSGSFTGVATEMAYDLSIFPANTITEPAAGEFVYYGQIIDLSSLSVTAGDGTSVVAALRLTASGDADIGTEHALWVSSGNAQFDDTITATNTSMGAGGIEANFTGTWGNANIGSSNATIWGSAVSGGMTTAGNAISAIIGAITTHASDAGGTALTAFTANSPTANGGSAGTIAYQVNSGYQYGLAGFMSPLVISRFDTPTPLTASTEAVGINFGVSATRTWATGALTTQRENYFKAPTYAFAGASTLTNAATVYIDAAPIAGSNATITNTYSLWVDAGNTRLDGDLDVQDINADFNGTATTNGVCHSGANSDTTATDRDLVVCSGSPGDIAEWYETTSGVAPAEIVVATLSTITYESDSVDALTGMVVGKDNLTTSILTSSSELYQSNIIGVVSSSPVQTIGRGVIGVASNPQPVAIAGRVPVKISSINGAIIPGDPITSSHISGVGMKATQPGAIVGYALEPWSDSTDGIILMVISPGWHAGGTIANDGTVSTFEGDFAFQPSGEADELTTGYNSHSLILRGSGWNSSTSTADLSSMSLVTSVNNADDYRLSFINTTGAEVAYITNTGNFGTTGDLIVGGRIYPSDKGVVQTDKYIYYDSTGEPLLDYMRTNAAGWSTGSYDFAEMFPSNQKLVSGEIVVFSTTSEHVERSTESYDFKLAGIVSTRPGFLAGDFNKDSYPIALAGRVPTKVSSENGLIAVGDPLTSSDTKPGYAMKATEAGPIVGYALEPYAGGPKERISVFVHLGYYNYEKPQEIPGVDNTASQVDGTLASLDMYGNLYMYGNEIQGVGRLSGIADSWVIEADGTFLTKGSYDVAIESYQGETVIAHSALSTEHKITLSGTSRLSSGQTQVQFEKFAPEFNDIISTTAPVRVFVTLREPANGIFVSKATNNGFSVEELMRGSSNAEFDWFVEAYRKGYEPEEELEIIIPEEEPIEEPVEDIIEEPVEVVEEPVQEEPVEEFIPAEPEPEQEVVVEEPVQEEPMQEPVEEFIPAEPAEEVVQEEPQITEPVQEIPTPDTSEVIEDVVQETQEPIIESDQPEPEQEVALTP
ncbi:MAG: hypothetical protein ABIH21_05645, partial [Patescibacteria group bacterium]